MGKALAKPLGRCYAVLTVQGGNPMTVPGDASPVGPPKLRQRRAYVISGQGPSPGRSAAAGYHVNKPTCSVNHGQAPRKEDIAR